MASLWRAVARLHSEAPSVAQSAGLWESLATALSAACKRWARRFDSLIKLLLWGQYGNPGHGAAGRNMSVEWVAQGWGVPPSQPEGGKQWGRPLVLPPAGDRGVTRAPTRSWYEPRSR